MKDSNKHQWTWNGGGSSVREQTLALLKEATAVGGAGHSGKKMARVLSLNLPRAKLLQSREKHELLSSCGDNF